GLHGAPHAVGWRPPKFPDWGQRPDRSMVPAPESGLWGDDSHKVYYGISPYRAVLRGTLATKGKANRAGGSCFDAAAADGETYGQPRRPSVRKLDGQAVIGRLDMRRQPPAQLVIVEVRMQIGQDRPPRLERLDQLERLVDAEVRRMRLVAERVDDPDIKVGERREALGREPDQIAGISEA